MKKFKFAVCGLFCVIASAFILKSEPVIAQEEYINGVLVTSEDYDDPEYIMYKNGTDRSSENDLDECGETVENRLSAAAVETGVTGATDYVSSTKSIFNSKTYYHNSKFSDYEILEGIDVSKWQGDINWTQVKASGVDFAIIRAAYRSSSNGSLNTDSKFITNLKNAKNAGIEHLGIYVFSQAATVAEGKAEANYAINLLKDYDIDLPIIMDVEYVDSKNGHFNTSISKATKTKICEAFCDTVEAAGYDAMIYSSKSFLENDSTDGLYGNILSEKYGIWVAQWASKNTYSYDYQMWQYSGDIGGGKVSGISGIIDCDYMYYKEPVSSNEDDSTTPVISDSILTMNSGSYKVLKVTDKTTGDKISVNWKSENPSVAYVTATGKVVAVGRGTTNIVAVTDSDEEVRCIVRVNYNINDYQVTGLTDSLYTGKDITKKLVVKSKTIQPYTGTVTAEVATIRKGPAASFKAVKTLAKNDKFSIIKKIVVQNTIWYDVKYTDEDGMVYSGYLFCGKTGTEYATIKSKYITLTPDTDYTVTYSNNKKPGVASVAIKAVAARRYSGTINGSFVILPKQVENVASVKRGCYYNIIGWDKVIYASGYNIYRADAYDGKYVKVGYVSASSTSLRFKDTDLEKGTCYYYKIRAVKKANGNIYAGKASTVFSTRTVTNVKQKATVTKNTYIFENAGTSYKKFVKLTAKTKLASLIAKSSDAKGNLWYYTTFTSNGKKYTGYVRASYLSFSMKGKVTCEHLNVRAGAGTQYKILTSVSKGRVFTITDEVNGWYKVTVTVNGTKRTGYVKKTYIQLI